jgi:hypothetical protein
LANEWGCAGAGEEAGSKKYFNMIGIRNPMSLEKFVW